MKIYILIDYDMPLFFFHTREEGLDCFAEHPDMLLISMELGTPGFEIVAGGDE